MKTFIFGAGSACKNYLSKNKKNNMNILGIIDNDLNKSGNYILGYRVYTPVEVFIEKQISFEKIIIASSFYEEIEKELVNEYNIEKEKIEIAPKSLISSTKSYRPFENDIVYNLANEIFIGLINDFNNKEISYFIDHGTLLGIVRHGSIMRWDDDIDFSVLDKDYDKIKKIVYTFFDKKFKEKYEHKYEIIEKYDDYEKERAIKILIKVEIESKEYIITIDIEKILMENGIAYGRFTKASELYFLKSEKLNFKDIKINIPIKSKEYLKYHYGEDWNIVKKDIAWKDINNLI